MLELWLGNTFLIDLILDFGNYSFFCVLFFYFYKKEFINQIQFFFMCILMLTPFLFNNSYFDWRIIPDQSKYFSTAYTIREGIFSNSKVEITDFSKMKMIIASYIFAYSPLLNIETFKSIGFLNRFLFLSSTIFFFKKKGLSQLYF